MSSMYQQKETKLINKFQSLLRSGMDYDTESMYKEAGESVFISSDRAKKIINRYYRGVVSQDMIDFMENLKCKKVKEQIKLFAEEFRICNRESRLIIRYIKCKK